MRQVTLYRVIFIERDAIAKNAEQRKESADRPPISQPDEF